MREASPVRGILGIDADAAICIGPIADPDFITMEIGIFRWMTCASPDFIECSGLPRTPADLDPLHCIALLEPGTQRAQEWMFRRQSETHTILPAAPLAFCDSDAAVAAAVHGGGYVRVLSIDAEQQIAAGLLRRVLEDWNDGSQPLTIVHARDSRARQEVLAFRDFVASLLPAHVG